MQDTTNLAKLSKSFVENHLYWLDSAHSFNLYLLLKQKTTNWIIFLYVFCYLNIMKMFCLIETDIAKESSTDNQIIHSHKYLFIMRPIINTSIQ